MMLEVIAMGSAVLSVIISFILYIEVLKAERRRRRKRRAYKRKYMEPENLYSTAEWIQITNNSTAASNREKEREKKKENYGIA